MDFIMYNMLIAIYLIIVCAASFFIGQVCERKQWNRLIEKGILPKPQQIIKKDATILPEQY